MISIFTAVQFTRESVTQANMFQWKAYIYKCWKLQKALLWLEMQFWSLWQAVKKQIKTFLFLFFPPCNPQLAFVAFRKWPRLHFIHTHTNTVKLILVYFTIYICVSIFSMSRIRFLYRVCLVIKVMSMFIASTSGRLFTVSVEILLYDQVLQSWKQRKTLHIDLALSHC